MNNIQELVYGFALRINNEIHVVSIHKAAFNVAVGTDKSDNTNIILLSPKDCPWIRVSTIEYTEIPKIKIRSKERSIEMSVQEWDKVRNGEVLELPSKNTKFKKYFSLNLDRLLEIAYYNGAKIDEYLIKVLKETYIK